MRWLQPLESENIEKQIMNVAHANIRRSTESISSGTQNRRFETGSKKFPVCNHISTELYENSAHFGKSFHDD